MKKIYSIAIVILAGAAVIASCSKETDFVNETAGEQQPASAKTITLSATLSDNLTKVGFSPVYDGVKPTGMELTWAEGDKLLVANHANPEQNAEFALAESCIGKKIGSFSGEMTFEATSYDVSIVSGDVAYGTQTQPSDGVATGLKYLASASEVTDLKSIVFDSFSSVLAITAKMPSTEVAAAIKSVDITASEDIFAGGKTLTITLGTPGDAGADAHLQLFATLPKGNQAIAAGTTLLVHFNAPDTDHTVYTRYIVLPAQTFTANKLNSIGIDASKSDQHAGLVSCDGTTAEKAYLIGDKYQMNAVHDLLVATSTIFFKMVADVDMTGITWAPLNNEADDDGHYSKYISFDGGNHTISNVSTATGTVPSYPSIFGVLNGSVSNLTIENATITPGANKAGVLAGYLGSGDYTSTSSVSNITIKNSTVGTSDAKGSAYCGILAAQLGKAGSTVSGISITGCTVASTNYTGGMIGYIGAAATVSGTNTVTNTNVYGSCTGGVIGYVNADSNISGCTYKKDGTGIANVTATARYAGGMIGSIGNKTIKISNCHVDGATVSSSADYVGGFAGTVARSASIDSCTVTGTSVNGTINIGGFAGVFYGTMTDCSAAGTVSSPNTTSNADIALGGMVGYFQNGSISNSSSSVVINQTTNGRDIGGFIGRMLENTTVEKCYCTGNVSGIQRNVGGFVGLISHTSTTTIAKIENCYCTGDVNANSYNGGFVGLHEKGATSITNCYSTGDVTGKFGMGGMIGFEQSDAMTMSKCVAWNSLITASAIAQNTWSSAAVVGVTFPKCTLTDNYRNPGMQLKAYWGNVTGYTYSLADDYQHANVSSSNPLIKQDGNATTATALNSGQPDYPQYPYHGKVEAGKTLSQLAKTTLGWSSDIWDFDGELPTLKPDDSE